MDLDPRCLELLRLDLVCLDPLLPQHLRVFHRDDPEGSLEGLVCEEDPGEERASNDDADRDRGVVERLAEERTSA